MRAPHNTDIFANHEKRKTKRFNSLVWNPECEQVDAFSVKWAGENNWLVPPIYLVPNVLRPVVQCKASNSYRTSLKISSILAIVVWQRQLLTSLQLVMCRVAAVKRLPVHQP